MKKVLLGTTALVASGLMAAPAMAADPIKINVGGYMQMFFAVGQISGFNTETANVVVGGPTTPVATNTSFRTPEIRYEGEIWFIGQTKLDNGTTVGIRIELEAWSQASGISANVPGGTQDSIDEEYIFAFGDWGRIEFGGTDSAAYKMVYAAPGVLPGFGFAQHNSFLFGTSAGNGAAHNGYAAALDSGALSDTNKITYYTPRFAGLQLGISYTPYMNPLATTAACGFPGSAGAGTAGCTSTADAYVNGVSLGVNYVNKFGDFGVAIYAGGSYMAFDRSFNAASAMNFIGADWMQAGGGINLSYAGFTFGGSFLWDNNGMIAGNESLFWTAGVSYATGPWAASFVYAGGTRQESAPIGVPAGAALNQTISGIQAGANGAFGQDTTHYFQLAGTYNLGPGVKLFAGGMYIQNSGQTAAESQSIWQIILGTELRF